MATATPTKPEAKTTKPTESKKGTEEKKESKPRTDHIPFLLAQVKKNKGPIHNKRFALKKDEEGIGGPGLELLSEQDEKQLYLQALKEIEDPKGRVVKIGSRAEFDSRAENPEGYPGRVKPEDKGTATATVKKTGSTSKRDTKVGTDGEPIKTPVRQKDEALATA